MAVEAKSFLDKYSRKNILESDRLFWSHEGKNKIKKKMQLVGLEQSTGCDMKGRHR